MPSLSFVVLADAIGALALIPTRRLFVAGWSSGALSLYYLALVGLGHCTKCLPVVRFIETPY